VDSEEDDEEEEDEDEDVPEGKFGVDRMPIYNTEAIHDKLEDISWTGTDSSRPGDGYIHRTPTDHALHDMT